jgi:hypothetical protein
MWSTCDCCWAGRGPLAEDLLHGDDDPGPPRGRVTLRRGEVLLPHLARRREALLRDPLLHPCVGLREAVVRADVDTDRRADRRSLEEADAPTERVDVPDDGEADGHVDGVGRHAVVPAERRRTDRTPGVGHRRGDVRERRVEERPQLGDGNVPPQRRDRRGGNLLERELAHHILLELIPSQRRRAGRAARLPVRRLTATGAHTARRPATFSPDAATFSGRRLPNPSPAEGSRPPARVVHERRHPDASATARRASPPNQRRQVSGTGRRGRCRGRRPRPSP